jgi:hypothetical protein
MNFYEFTETHKKLTDIAVSFEPGLPGQPCQLNIEGEVVEAEHILTSLPFHWL